LNLELRKSRPLLEQELEDEVHDLKVQLFTSCSDRFGNNDPSEVLYDLRDPQGKAFLFLDINMGPDVICLGKDEEKRLLFSFKAKFKDLAGRH